MPEPEAESAVIHHAAALAANSPKDAASYLHANATAHAASQMFYLEAGKVLEAANAPQLALPFFNTALSLKRNAAVVERLFACHLRLGNTREAARMLMTALETGYRTALRRDFATLLRRLGPGELNPVQLATLAAKFGTDILVGPSLLLHLIAAGKPNDIESIAGNDAIDARNWDEDLVMQTAAFLEGCGRPEIALRLLCRCGGQSEAYLDRLVDTLDRYTSQQLRELVLPMLAVPEGRYNTIVYAEPYLEIAERFARAEDTDGLVETLVRLKQGIESATGQALDGPSIGRIGRLAPLILAKALERDDLFHRLAGFLPLAFELEARGFFSGEAIENLIANLSAAPIADASAGTRRALLREGYFRHHMARRESEPVPAAPSDFEICRLAHRYFQWLAPHIPPDAVPLPTALAETLRRPALSLDRTRSISTFMAYLSMQWSPVPVAFNEGARSAIDNALSHYATMIVPNWSVPSTFIPDWLVAELNVVPPRNGPSAVNVTRFLDAVWRNSPVYEKKYDLDRLADSLLLFLELVATQLSRNTQLRPFFSAMVPAEGTEEHAFLRKCLHVLMGDRATRLLSALAGHDETLSSPATAADGPQPVLLVGHASKATGLARNVRMLHDALKASAGDGIATEILDYDARGFEVTARLAAWRRASGTRPIVIYAINAEDVPWAMLKDVRGSLDDAYNVGFFLWEMSRAPHVQDLGIELVDEVWTPSRYVADIYAPLAPTHMIGKGLYDPAAPMTRAAGKPFRFLTVFDFDSSIERKNPLAVVQAFQRAFPSGDDVELVVKGLAVRPDHWSNALGHWERLNAAIAGDRRIRLITTRLSDAEMEDLFRTAGCMVSLHRGEGFGYVISDAMAMGMPVVATDYSGNADYCTPENSFPVAYKLIPVDPRVAQWATNGAQWADADIASAAAQMRAVFEKRDHAAVIGARGRETVLGKYPKEAFRRTVLERINDIRARL